MLLPSPAELFFGRGNEQLSERYQHAGQELVRFPATPYLFRVGERGRIALDPEVAAELEQAAAAARREIATPPACRFG